MTLNTLFFFFNFRWLPEKNSKWPVQISKQHNLRTNLIQKQKSYSISMFVWVTKQQEAMLSLINDQSWDQV